MLWVHAHPCISAQVEKGTQGVDGRVVNPKSKGTYMAANGLALGTANGNTLEAHDSQSGQRHQ